ncbi:MAG: DUF1015 domain-containing protein [Acidobacteria bacterium]|nr:DUF1015 domain-containing protein [Acidobacteriota bacterium]
MAKIKPFRALRPDANDAKEVSSVPYDVLNAMEARAIAASNPMSFLRVSRSEIDLPDGADPYSDAVYAKAKENLARLQSEGILKPEGEPCLYVYQLRMGEQVQTSVVACCAIDEYDDGRIKKHEKTRPDKENDRTRHMIELEAQTGLIFLCYRGTDELNSLIGEVTKSAPLFDFWADDINKNSIRNTVWKISTTEPIVRAFEDVPSIYIADGHHRAASSSRARAAMRDANPQHTGDEEYNFVIAALFPAEQLRILPYNRVVKDLNGLSSEEFLAKTAESGFVITEADSPEPQNPGEICVYLEGRWHRMLFNIQYFAAPPVIESLDVSRLENFVLRPILGIEDVRTDKRIDFIGGIRGTEELERLVDSGAWKVAFSMFPTTVGDLLQVSDENQIMPPKSTWFEPKLRDGLLIHCF